MQSFIQCSSRYEIDIHDPFFEKISNYNER